MCDIRSIRVETDDISLGIDSTVEGKDRARKVVRCEAPVLELVAMSYSTAICVSSNDRALRI